MPRHSIRILGATLVALSLFSAVAGAQEALRAWGLTGSCVARAHGLEAVGRNPALLADSSEEGYHFGLASLGLDIGNNSLSLSRYNEISGAILDEQDKRNLLDDLPSGGLRLDAGLDASVLGFRYGRFAVSTQLIGRGGGTVDKDVFELVLFGNEIDRAFSFEDTEAQGFAVGAVALSYAQPVYADEHFDLSAGANVRYLYGIYEFRTEEASGGLVTTLDGLQGSAEARFLSAQGGSGFSMDFGLAGRLDERWHMGLMWESLVSSMNWNRDVEHRLWTVDAVGLAIGEEEMDDAVVEHDSTWAGDSYTGTLPSTLRLGVLRDSDLVTLALETEIRMRRLQGAQGGPTALLGAEWQALSWLRPRMGLGVGSGAKGIVTGLGFRLGFFHMDLAAGTRGGYWPNGTKGLSLGSAFAFNF